MSVTGVGVSATMTAVTADDKQLLKID